MSTLVMNLYYPQLPVGRGLTKGLVVDELDGVERCLDVARAAAGASQPGRPDGALLRDEVAFSADLVALLLKDARARCRGDGFLSSVPASKRAELGAELDALTGRYRDLWLANNRPGGLDDSVGWLGNLRQAYATGRPDPEWGGIRVPTRD
jgi:hypothetical protein